MADAIKLRYLTAQREKMSPMVKGYWAELDAAAEQGRPVVYCLGFTPQELFRTADGVIFFGENFGASCAVARVSQELCELAEAHGYPVELCSYIRTNVGAMLSGRNPMGKTLPKPDLISYLNCRCTSYAGWGKAIAELYPGVPQLPLDVPSMRDGVTAEEHGEAVKYVTRQIEEMIGFLDGWRGKRFDRDLFGEMVDNTGRGARAFKSLQDKLGTKPAPISLIDIFFQLFPMVCLKGRPEMADYYEAAKAEVDVRIAEGYAAVPEERYRVYWDGIAIWTRLANQFAQLARHGAALVSSLYTYDMPAASAHYDGRRPAESIAEGLIGAFSNIGVQGKIDYITRMVQQTSANAILMQVSRSCKPYFMEEQMIIKEVSSRTGVPFCQVYGDMADPRMYSEQEIENRIETFFGG